MSNWWQKFSQQQSIWVTILTLSSCWGGNTNLTQAQVIPDDTLGNEASVVNQISETLQQIEGGALRGENLFHSFLEFSINEGSAVYFSNPAEVLNIFSRVTGNNISQILGQLGVLGDANLYFVNPNGILFGPNAQLDIAGSFIASSGSGFILPNGMEYSATNPQAPPLLTVNATAPIGIRFEGSEGIITNQAELTATNNLTLAGNQLDLQGQIVTQGDLTLQASDLISIKNGIIDVRGNEGGSINASAKNININNAQVLAGIGEGLGFENAQSGDINFNVAENLTISDSSAIANAVFGVGNSGDIVINTGSLSLQNEGQIIAGIFGQGNAGILKIEASEEITVDGETGNFQSAIFNSIFQGAIGKTDGIVIDTPNLLLINGGQITANVFAKGEGDVGAVKITATEGITLDGGNGFNGGIYNSIVGGGEGTTEGIVINTGSLSVINGGQILANVFGEGNAGAVKITVTEGITIDGETNAPFNVGIFSTVLGVGRSGGIVIDTGFLSLTNGGQIASSIFREGEGDAGAINIKADQGITIDGEGIVNGETFASSIFSNVQENGIGTTGGVVIDTTSLSLTNRGIINANLFGEGDTGAVQIKASEGITIDGETNDDIIGGIYSNVIGIGTSGGIFIDTTTLSLTNGGHINANTFGKGDSGLVQIKASEGITIDGETSTGSFSQIFSAGSSDAVGDSGGIEIYTTTLSLTNGAEISTSISGRGNSGEVKFKATEGIVIDGETRKDTVGESNLGIV